MKNTHIEAAIQVKAKGAPCSCPANSHKARLPMPAMAPTFLMNIEDYAYGLL